MTKSKLGPKDLVWATAKKATLMSLLFPLLGTGISYAAYADDLSISEWPWRIGLLVTLACFLLPFVVSWTYRRTNLLWVYGLVMSIAIFAVYFYFGIFAYFFYFLFAPMSSIARWPGLLGGIALTLYWAVMSKQAVMRTITTTSFVNRAFDENESDLSYKIQTGTALFERLHKERSPFPKVYMYIVFGLAPFYLILSRMLSSGFGANGVLVVLAVLGMPVSLWFLGVLIRINIVMIGLPRKLEKERRKPVLVAD
ncbi:hypothetical protein LMG24238_06204 [Paraburkholderia sediminicola]|uniref:Uncharacterized protein n=1 Tax=Paraburkholderia sediminicola TaxID=458836 RepID=A0A6J5CK32_9BURK|nr:hypothetical protein [Paraburkholderia sediminicola]CAB3736182.1 hypothetical protein LMG24238_06204 [Paraburkholderia sediminicola]